MSQIGIDTGGRTVPAAAIRERVDSLPWPDLHDQLDDSGFAYTPPVLSAAECRDVDALYETAEFRSTVDMARFRFGRGQYKYFADPLPQPVASLRTAFYPWLAEAANRWATRLGEDRRFPDSLTAFQADCRDAGQTQPTPLMLRYRTGDWNALHQDIYGDVAFPLQAVTLLSRPGQDFEGGEFILVEQRARAQSRAHVLPLQRGAFLIFTTRQRPVRGSRGVHRSAMRHGISALRSGQRTTLGIIFHDAA